MRGLGWSLVGAWLELGWSLLAGEFVCLVLIGVHWLSRRSELIGALVSRTGCDSYDLYSSDYLSLYEGAPRLISLIKIQYYKK